MNRTAIPRRMARCSDESTAWPWMSSCTGPAAEPQSAAVAPTCQVPRHGIPHPRRSAFAVSHGLDGLTFLLPPGVFQPVTLMGFGYLLEYPWKVAGSGGRSHRRRVSLHDGFAGTRSVNHRSGSASGSSRKPGRVASVVEEVGVFPTGPALKPTAVAADTTGVPDR